ncbi:MerR family transcriptional regulator [Fredinandcohnia humi]
MYSIGQFSKICNVSVKTLRYYSDIGLLEPSYVDPMTNYRYYDFNKIQIFEKINLLKSCHFPLATIKSIITCEHDVYWLQIIEKKLIELEKEKETIESKIVELREMKRNVENAIPLFPEPASSDCFIEERDETMVVALREKIEIKFINQLVKSLFDRAYAFNLVINGKLMAIFHDRSPDGNEADVELLLPIEEGNGIDSYKTIPSGLYACITVAGPYSNLKVGYNKLTHWMKHQRLTPKGKEIEIFENGLVPGRYHVKDIKPENDKDPAEFLTKICIPVRQVTTEKTG